MRVENVCKVLQRKYYNSIYTAAYLFYKEINKTVHFKGGVKFNKNEIFTKLTKKKSLFLHSSRYKQHGMKYPMTF